MIEIIKATIYGLTPIAVFNLIGLSLDAVTKAYRESRRKNKETFRG
jgi:hypothetical protein